MKTLLPFLLLSSLLTAISPAQTPQSSPAANSAPEQARFAEGTVLRAQLDKTIDTKKAKAGDPILAKTMDELRSGSQLIAPKGAKIFGHVVASAPHQGESPSTLSVAFDKMELANGTEVPLKAVIQAVAKFETASPAGYGSSGGYSAPAPAGGAPSGRSGMTPGVGNGTNAAPSPGPPPADAGAAPVPSSGSISPNAEGVMGMSGVSLSIGAAQESVLTSPKHNVKLEGGTQMILKTE